jgi:hypothetical protein
MTREGGSQLLEAIALVTVHDADIRKVLPITECGDGCCCQDEAKCRRNGEIGPANAETNEAELRAPG